MSVDFNGIGPGQVNNQRTTADKSGAAKASQAPASEQARSQAQQNVRGENLSLSKQAKELKDLEQKLGGFPEMDDNRIEQIRGALADGSYKVDAEKLAQKMLEMDQSIFG